MKRAQYKGLSLSKFKVDLQSRYYSFMMFHFVGGATEAAFFSWQSHLSRVAIASLYMLLYYIYYVHWVWSSDFS